MCRICVSKGILTQEEYDRERAAGNPEIFPLNELPPELALTMMREMFSAELGHPVTDREMLVLLALDDFLGDD